MEEALRAWLLASAAITAIASTRIDWNVVPQAAGVPSIVLHRITGIRDYHMQGASGVVRTMVQIDCWAFDYPNAVTLARAVRDRLSGIGASSVATFQSVMLLNERQDFVSDDSPIHGSSERFHRVSLDFEIWHSE